MIAASARKSTILKSNGEPFETQPRFRPSELIDMKLAARSGHGREINARFDAAQQTDEMERYWVNADSYDADSANSRSVRVTLMHRARYEVGNNPFVDGMVQTCANYLIGTGPTIRFTGGTPEFNAKASNAFAAWARAVMFRRKLYCMAHAKVQDGEGGAVLRNNPAIPGVRLDVVPFEAEQMHTPYVRYMQPGHIDGIRFDEFGNPYEYDLMPYHPGASWAQVNPQAEKIPARYMLHWFMLRRPGQHRAVSELRSVLNTGANARRFRESTLAAADSAASYAGILKTQQMPDSGNDPLIPMSTTETERRMLMALPGGWDFSQFKAEHPNATYSEFIRSHINEMGRPKHLPYGMAACDSAQYNFASGKLDRQPLYLAIDVERCDCEELVISKVVDEWWKRAVNAYYWVGMDQNTPLAYAVDWPALPEGDENAVADAAATKLDAGLMSPSQWFSDNGFQFEEKIAQMANDYGVTVQEMKALLRRKRFEEPAAPATVAQAPAGATA